MKFINLLLQYLNRKSNNLTIIKYNGKSQNSFQIATKSAIAFAVVYNFYSYLKKFKTESYLPSYNKPPLQLFSVLHAREKNKTKVEAELNSIDEETEVKFYFSNS